MPMKLTERPGSLRGKDAVKPLVDEIPFFLKATLWTLACASLIFITLYHFGTYQSFFHSDGAYRNTLAAEILRTGRLFPEQWNFVNDIPFVFGHLVIVALGLLGANPNSYFLNALSGFVTTLALLAATIFFCRTARTSLPATLLGVALLISGFSERILEVAFGMSAYGPIATLVLFGLSAAFRILDESHDESSRRRNAVALFGIVGAGTVSGTRMPLSFTVPLLIAIAAFILVEHAGTNTWRRLSRPIAMLGATLLGGTALGLVIFFYVRGHVSFNGVSTGQGYAQLAELERNVNLVIAGSLYFFGALPDPGRTPYSIYGIFTAYRFVACLAFLSLPLILLRRYRSLGNPFLRFALLFYLANFGLITYFFVFGNIAINIEGYRYFSVSIILLLLILACALDEIRQWPRTYVISGAIALALPIILSNYAFTGFSRLAALGQTAPPGRWRLTNGHEPLAKALVARNLKFGYATFWHAPVTTILSDGGSEVRQVQFLGSRGIIPHRHLSSNDWYTEQYHKGPTFLVVADKELPSIDFAVLQRTCGTPRETFKAGEYNVYVYPSNVFVSLPGWK